MRRIRFKARAIKSGKMIEGYYAHHYFPKFDNHEQKVTGYDEQDSIYNDEPGNNNGAYWVNIDPETLCQQTSMDDMFQLPIWEHDIVRLYSIRVGMAKCSDPLHEQTGEVIFLQTAYAVQFEDGSNHTISHLRRHYDIQVIGNAFERRTFKDS